ncbi:MAG: TraM recognition domain-containing protein, partial [Eggerthellaceae bacterium]|nr:TraM recognition domain-containing protein [Eggerthellaceae bacterium]
AARSRNIRFHFVLQSEHQLSNVYGDQVKEVILDNVDNWFFMGSRGLQFLKHVSELTGERENASGKVEPVMSVAKLQRLEKRDDETETLVLMGSLKPFVTPLKDISQYESVDNEGAAPAPRRQIERSIFDVEAVVRDMKEKKIREIMDREMREKGEKPIKKHPKKTIDEDILEGLRKMAAESAAE